jgi:predicted RNA-binding Zn-ribbon protein involved in translation (DUF1610 family)
VDFREYKNMSADFITLSCPSCGGKLQVSNSIDHFACANCGTEHIVRRGGGIVSLEQVMGGVKQGVDKTASELAIVRLNKEIAELENQRKIVINQYKPKGLLTVAGVVSIALAIWATCGTIGLVLESPGHYFSELFCMVGIILLLFLGGLGLVLSGKNESKHQQENYMKHLAPLDKSIKEHYDLLAKHKQIISSE